MSAGPDYSKELSPGWVLVSLGEIATVQSGVTKNSKKQDSDGREVPYLRVANVQRGWLDLTEVKTIYATESQIQQSILQPGDVLFNEGGDRDKLGRGWVWNGEIADCIHQNHVFRARLHEEIHPKYVSYYGNSWGSDYFLSAGKQTTNLASLNQRTLKALPIRLAPLPEQHRIVAEIEKHFTRLDDAVATLERVRANLERARASVLKAAVEGRLVPTEAELARAEGRSYEPASVLLERILVERKRKHEETNGKKKYKPPVQAETNGLPELPEGWARTTLDTVAEVIGGITKNKGLVEGREVPYLRVANVQRGYLDLSVVKTILAPEEKIEKLRLLPGDILLNEGGDRDKLGRGWIWEGQIEECIHQNHVFRARVIGGLVVPKYVSHYANSVGQSYFLGSGKQTTNLASISLANMKSLPFPLPPAPEQSRIAAEVDRRLSVLDAIALTITRNLARCTSLRQSILARAFSGKLVPQDPTDEPASALLARIQAHSA